MFVVVAGWYFIVFIAMKSSLYRAALLFFLTACRLPRQVFAVIGKKLAAIVAS